MTTQSFNINTTVSNSIDSLANVAPPPAPKFTISNVRVNEGNTGLTQAKFVVKITLPPLEGNTPGEIPTVKFATVNGKAKAGSDYVATNGTLTFAKGKNSATITVNVKGDKIVEPNETFLVRLYTPDNKLITGVKGTGTIKNDDKKKTKDLLLGNIDSIAGSTEAHSFTTGDDHNTGGSFENVRSRAFDSQNIRLSANTLGSSLIDKSLEILPTTQGVLTSNSTINVFPATSDTNIFS